MALEGVGLHMIPWVWSILAHIKGALDIETAHGVFQVILSYW
jgi:hypothetical protein